MRPLPPSRLRLLTLHADSTRPSFWWTSSSSPTRTPCFLELPTSPSTARRQRRESPIFAASAKRTFTPEQVRWLALSLTSRSLTPIPVGDEPPLPFATLLSLYSKLSPKLSISSWMEENAIDGNRIDVRRMIQFGVIKGFLRRVYAYPIWLDHPSYSPTPNRHETSASAARRYSATHRPTHPLQPLSSTIDSRPDLGRHTSSIFSGDSSNPESLPTPRPRTPRDAPAAPTVRTALARAPTASSISAAHEAPLPSPFSAKLPPMLDGTHHTDEICVGFGIGLKQLEAALRMIGGEGKDEDAGSLGDGLRRVVGGYGSRVVMLYV